MTSHHITGPNRPVRSSSWRCEFSLNSDKFKISKWCTNVLTHSFGKIKTAYFAPLTLEPLSFHLLVLVRYQRLESSCVKCTTCDHQTPLDVDMSETWLPSCLLASPTHPLTHPSAHSPTARLRWPTRATTGRPAASPRASAPPSLLLAFTFNLLSPVCLVFFPPIFSSLHTFVSLARPLLFL